jgi:hypothetical protein
MKATIHNYIEVLSPLLLPLGLGLVTFIAGSIEIPVPNSPGETTKPIEMVGRELALLVVLASSFMGFIHAAMRYERVTENRVFGDPGGVNSLLAIPAFFPYSIIRFAQLCMVVFCILMGCLNAVFRAIPGGQHLNKGVDLLFDPSQKVMEWLKRRQASVRNWIINPDEATIKERQAKAYIETCERVTHKYAIAKETRVRSDREKRLTDLAITGFLYTQSVVSRDIPQRSIEAIRVLLLCEDVKELVPVDASFLEHIKGSTLEEDALDLLIKI